MRSLAAHVLACCVQVQHAQRNLAANAQRKFVTSVYLPEGFKSGDDVQPSFPVEVKDVVLISWSPSGKP